MGCSKFLIWNSGSADWYRNLVAQRDAPVSGAAKRDKCAEQKRAERELKEALKVKRQGELDKRRQEQDAQKHVIKDERLFNGPTSKRAREDLRKLDKKMAKEEAGSQLCEHGVNKCRICFPPSSHKPPSHHQVRPLGLADVDEL